MVNVDKSIKTIDKTSLGDINRKTVEFMGIHIIDLMFSTDKMSKNLSLRAHYAGEDGKNFESVKDLLNNDPENAILSCTEVARVDSVYNPQAPNEKNIQKFYKETFLTYPSMVEIAKAYELEFNLVSEENGEAVFELAWADKNKFTDVNVPTSVDWIPKK